MEGVLTIVRCCLRSKICFVISAEWIHDDNRQQFRDEGYMVIRSVVPASVTSRAVREIAAFVGADLSDSTAWYRGAPELDGIVPLHHAQSLWDVRQCPALYEVFTEFFGNARLMVDMNRCIFRPPSIRTGRPSVAELFIDRDTDPKAATSACPGFIKIWKRGSSVTPAALISISSIRD
jgi:hypothetical protein